MKYLSILCVLIVMFMCIICEGIRGFELKYVLIFKSKYVFKYIIYIKGYICLEFLYYLFNNVNI